MSLLAAVPLRVAAAGEAAVAERTVCRADAVVPVQPGAVVGADVVDDLAAPPEGLALVTGERALLGRVLFARHLNASFLERRRLLGATDQPNDNRDNPGKAHPASLPPDVVDRLTHDRYNEDQGDTERERGYRQGWNDHARHMLRMFAAREAM